MSLISSRFGPADMEALLWDPSSPMVDPLESYLDRDDEVLPLGGAESPLSSFSSSPLPSLSPPCTPPSFERGEKAGLVQPSLSWISSDELCLDNDCTGGGKEHSFSEMDWMTERIDLSEFDLDSLIDSYDSEDPPSSPEELIASLESQIELDSLPLPSENIPSPSSLAPVHLTPASVSEIDQLSSLLFTPVTTPLICSASPEMEDSSSVVPEPQSELEIKSEPASPVPSPSTLPPESPTDTLELGCEVDISEVQSPSPIELRVPKIVLSLSPTRIVLVLAPKEEVNVIATPLGKGEVVVKSSSEPTSPKPQTPPSPQSHSLRVKPYPTPNSKPTQVQHSESPTLVGKVKSASCPKVVVEKQLKKMEQNKTAATRYRQKKRAEQDALLSECAALEERNQELVEKADTITKEIQYLKELMEEVKRVRQSKECKMS